MKDLGCVGWFLDDDIRCGWDDVLLLELTLCWDHKSLSLIWVFGELFVRTQGVRMYCYAYWTIDVVLLLELTLCWDHKSLSFIWVFGELFARTQGVRMYWYAYWTIGGFMSVMNIWMVNIWYYNL